MKKLPMYLAVFAEDYKTTQKNIRFQCKQALTQLQESIDKNQEKDMISITNDLANFNDVFSLPSDVVHMTALYIGGKQLKNNQKNIYNQFKNDQKKVIKVDCIVYIPGFILAGYVSNTDGVVVQNQFPHVTLLLSNSAKAVQSNFVIQAVNKANNGLIKKGGYKTQKYSCPYTSMDNKKKFQFAYVIKKEIEIKGITGSNVMYGKRK